MKSITLHLVAGVAGMLACACSLEEGFCGWQRADEIRPGRADLLADPSTIRVPTGECVIVLAGEDGRVAPPDTSPCELEEVGRRCAILWPGEEAALFAPAGSGRARGRIGWGPAERCPFACDPE
jgi:hypothetical protein